MVAPSGPVLPVAVPEPIAIGEPDHGYPYRWAVHRWLPGDGASLALMEDPVGFALELADLVRALQRVPTEGAPEAVNRARPLAEYNEATLGSISYASTLIDADRARAVWEEALAAPAHRGPSVWVHGDIEGNCLVSDGRLSGVVDWGSACAATRPSIFRWCGRRCSPLTPGGPFWKPLLSTRPR